MDEVSALSEHWQWIQVFENKGAPMGASNPHPHGQIWASDFLPTEARKESACQRRWRNAHPQPLLLHYAQLESAAGTRTIIASEHWIVVIPWWALWPFETLLIPRRELTPSEADDLARVLKRLMQGYDALFAAPFPYSMGWHGAPCGADAASGWQLHAHIFPPLLRSASVRKFMVGYEMFAEGQRDLTPEEAAARLQTAVVSATQG
jgi:UDPglucose--hexose-1-phosphate uridylyltransferase